MNIKDSLLLGAVASLAASQAVLHLKIDRTLTNQENIMAALEEFQAALSAVDAETTRIGAYIDEILGQLNRTDLTAEQETVLLADLQAAADRLRLVGASVGEPVPPGELPPVEG